MSDAFEPELAPLVALVSDRDLTDPVAGADLAVLAPACISATTFDLRRDETIDGASRLLQAGVPTELHGFPGTFPGSGFVGPAAIARRADEHAQVALRRGLRLDGTD